MAEGCRGGVAAGVSINEGLEISLERASQLARRARGLIWLLMLCVLGVCSRAIKGQQEAGVFRRTRSPPGVGPGEG